MNKQAVARELMAVAKELTAAKSMRFDKLKLGTPFKYKGTSYWKASPTRAVLRKHLVRIRPDEEVSV